MITTSSLKGEQTMKKILSVLLALCLCFVLAACGGEQKDASALYQSAMTKIDKDNMAAVMSINADVETGGMTTNVTMEMDMASKTAGDDTTMSMKMNMGAMGMTIDMAMYMADGYYYADMLGMKVKQKISEAGIDLTGQLSDLSGSLLLDESVITIEKAEQKDGNTVISFTVSKDKMNELVELLSSQMMSGASNITIESVSGTVTVDKNETLVAETMNIAYTMDTNGETGSANMTMELKDIRFGDSVTVELPDDLDEYVESSDGSIEL